MTRLTQEIRGIVFANCIISAWFSGRLQDYVWEHSLLPHTQIATQRRVQPGDLTAFLAHIHHAARYLNEPVWAKETTPKASTTYKRLPLKMPSISTGCNTSGNSNRILPRRSPRHYRATKPDVIHGVQRVIPFTTHPKMLRTGFL